VYLEVFLTSKILALAVAVGSIIGKMVNGVSAVKAYITIHRDEFVLGFKLSDCEKTDINDTK
jgi:hypothetical protein